MFRMFLRYFKPHMKLFVIDIICAVMVALIDLAFPLVSRYAMKNMLPNKEYRLFFILMISMIGFYVLRSVCQYVMTDGACPPWPGRSDHFGADHRRCIDFHVPHAVEACCDHSDSSADLGTGCDAQPQGYGRNLRIQ